jgi:hypothetical protein
MESQKNKFNYNRLVIPVFIIVAFTALAYFGNKSAINHNKLLKQHKLFTSGVLLSYYHSFTPYSGTYDYTYSYFLKSKKYLGTISTRTNDEIGYEIINKKFPVVYDSLEPSNSSMLIFPKDFQYFGLPFPDSLNWVKFLSEVHGCSWDILTDTIK